MARPRTAEQVLERQGQEGGGVKEERVNEI